MNRRFAPTPRPVPNTLGSRLTTERLPLDLALSLAVEIVDAVATAHQQRRAFGRLSPADFEIAGDGSLIVTAPPLEGADPATDNFAVGTVLYQLFTGLTPNQARARLAVSPLHEAPLASKINPAIDDTLEGLLSMMLDKNPQRRPHSLRVIEGLLNDVCESLDVEPSRGSIASWASAHPAVAVAAPPKKHRPSYVVVLADEDVIDADEDDSELEDDEAEREEHDGPMRFDKWAVAACAFAVVAFTMATKL
jgi:hypothetical protein